MSKKPAKKRTEAMRPWYADGLRFGCTRSGRCCTNHGNQSFVYVSGAEMLALARHLELDLDAFRRRYTKKHGGDRVLRDADDRCIFLDDDNLCRVHPARPIQCRTWPFWPENLKRSEWHGPVKALCRGIGRGRLYSRAEIEARARATDEAAE